MSLRFTYHRPSVGDIIETGNGRARVSSVATFSEIIEQMRLCGASENDIERFKLRIAVFLKDLSRYYEVDVVYENGETERIDWSEKNRMFAFSAFYSASRHNFSS